MKQSSYGRDRQLTFRMFFTMFMLGMVYLAFLGLLFIAGISPIFIGLITKSIWSPILDFSIVL